MSERSSFWCSSFSPFWWWLLALLGLPILFFLMNHFHQPKIESDLTKRVTEALAAEGIDWAEVDINQRGRDVLLKGAADDDASRDQALEIARGVYGVNQVAFADDQMGNVGDGADKQHMAADDSGAMDNAQEDGSGTDMKDDGVMEDEADTKSGQPDEVQAVDATEEVRLPAELSMKMEGDQLVLDGKMATQQQIDTLQQEAALRVGVTKVVNNLEVDPEYAEAAWLDTLSRIMGTLPAGTAVKIKGEVLELSGTVASDTELEKLRAHINRTISGSGLQLQDTLEVVEKPKEPSPEEQAAAKAAVCQERLNTVMQDKKILFTFGAAEINAESNVLLDDLAKVIGECSDGLSDMVIIIGGHTDNVGQDAYNLDLSQRRAKAVLDYLRNKQVDEALLEAKGFGEASPVASNDTVAGQARNRRITFEIKRK